MADAQTRGKQQGSKQARLPVQNMNSSLIVPPFGLVAGTGWLNGVMQVNRPSTDNQQVYVNGPAPIAAQGFGAVSMAWPLFAAYDPASGTPAFGQTWGAAANSFLLTKGKTGLLVQSAPAANRVLVMAQTQAATVAPFSGAQIVQAQANISVANNTYYKLTPANMAGGGFDTDGYTTAIPGSLMNTNNKGVYFLLTAGVRWQNNATGYRYLQITANGNTVASDCRSASSDFTDQCVSCVISTQRLGIVNVPIDVYVLHNAGVTLTLNYMTLSPYNWIAGLTLVRLDSIAAGGSTGLVVGSTPISGGTSGQPLYDFGGVLGEVGAPVNGTFGG